MTLSRLQFLRSLLVAPFATKALLRPTPVSGKTLASCHLRFPASTVPFPGFPGGGKIVSLPYGHYPPTARLREWRRQGSPYDPVWLDEHSRWPDQAVRQQEWEAALERIRRGERAGPYIVCQPLGVGRPIRGYRHHCLVLDEAGHSTWARSKPLRQHLFDLAKDRGITFQQAAESLS